MARGERKKGTGSFSLERAARLGVILDMQPAWYHPDGHWFLDTFLKSGESERTLYAEQFLHPVGEWFHAALVYESGRMRHYVNGAKELEGTVNFLAMAGGRTSVDSRLNRVYWFKGAVKEISLTPQALPPAEFVLR